MGVPSIPGSTKYVIECVRPQTKFWCVGFANHDATSGTHARGHEAILGGWAQRCERRALAGAKALHISQIFDRLRQAMHPTHRCSAGQLGIPLVSLSQDGFSRGEANDGVAARIVLFDLMDVSQHDFATRDLLAVDGLRQSKRRHIGDDHEIF
jgi:hypothetical protein